ncbi:MAG: NADH-quinone oxidoreductase subunit J [Pseudomonadota bacterium]
MNAGLAFVFALLGVAASALAATRTNAARAVAFLLASLLALGAAFFALDATFAGALQILVYAGAVVAVFIFVLITVDSSARAIDQEGRGMRQAWPAAALASALILAPLVFAPVPADPPSSVTPSTTKDVGTLLFGPWAIAVEAASFLLLAALIGVRHIGGRDRNEEEG